MIDKSNLKILEWVGSGRIIPTIPPRDLTKEDLQEMLPCLECSTVAELKKTLIGTGLYTAYKAKKSKKEN